MVHPLMAIEGVKVSLTEEPIDEWARKEVDSRGLRRGMKRHVSRRNAPIELTDTTTVTPHSGASPSFPTLRGPPSQGSIPQQPRADDLIRWAFHHIRSLEHCGEW